MNKKLTKIFAIALSSAMGMAMAAPAFMANAATATPKDTGSGTVTGSKTLKVLDRLTNNAAFEFTLASGTKGTTVPTNSDGDKAVESMEYFPGVVAGVKANGTALSAAGTFNLTFNATDASFILNEDSDTVADDDYSYYRKPIVFDFSEVDWDKGAGAYVYTVNETNAGSYLKTGGAYTIYVYVTNKLKDDGSKELDVDDDGNPKLEISDVVVTDPSGNKQGTDPDDDDKDDYAPEDPDNPGNKDESANDKTFESKGDFDFLNEENAQALEITKKVKGNQASTTKEFAFEIKLDGADGTYKITGDADGGKDAATEIVVTDGEGTGTIYLKHGDTANIYIPEGVSYTIKETTDGYTASATITGDAKANFATDTVTGEMDADGATVEFVNTLDGTIPTGVLLTVAPFAALALAGIGGAAVVLKKKKDEDEE